MRNWFKFACVILLTVVLTSRSSIHANAHEMFVNGSTPIQLKWSIKSAADTFYHTKVNYDLLSSKTVYRDNAPDAIKSWLSNPTKSYCTYESFNNSNVDLVTMTKSNWSQNGYSYYTLAVTWLTDTNGLTIKTNAHAKSSSKKIRYAAIYFNPDHDKNLLGIAPTIVGNQNQQLGTIVHEIGHAYTLGHCDTLYNIVPDSTKSIMRAEASYNMPTTLQQHDIDDMNAKYK